MVEDVCKVFAKFLGLIGSISIKRKPCNLFLTRRWSTGNIKANNQPVKPGVIPLKSILKQAIWSQKTTSVATGAIRLTAPKMNMRCRQGLAKGKAPIPWHDTFWWILFYSLETFALQRKQTSEVKMFFSVSMALIAILKLLLVPASLHMYASVIFFIIYIILLVNNKTKNLTWQKSFLWLEFADVVLPWRQATARNVSAFSGYDWLNHSRKR